jgi:methyltransferase-like protein
MNTYPITKNNKQLELQRINTLLQNNNYPPHVDINTKKNIIKTHHPIQLKRKNGQFLHT